MTARPIASLVAALPLAGIALLAGPTAASAHPVAPAKHVAPHYTFSPVQVKFKGKVCPKLQLAGINSHGTMVGTEECVSDRAFVRKAGGATGFFRGPGGRSLMTIASGIASNGTVSLFTLNRGKPQAYTSYLRSASGHFTKIVAPDAGPVGAEVLSVNAHGTAIGDYFTADANPKLEPFIYRAGKVKPFTLGVSGATSVILTGITNTGLISGQYSDHKKAVHSFLYRSGTVTTVRVPGAPTTPRRGASLTGVASSKLFAGSIYRKTTITGFAGINGTYFKVIAPGSKQTFCESMNSSKTIVGYDENAAGKDRGFIAHFVK